jgi:hypothetical protein
VAADPITIVPGRIDLDVITNNNITMRNLTVVDLKPGKVVIGPGRIGTSPGTYLYLGNPLSAGQVYDFHFTVPDNGASHTTDITREAEVRVVFDDDGWNSFNNSGQLNQPGIEIINEKEIIITGPDITLHQLTIPAETRFPVYIGFNFLTDSITDNRSYEYQIWQAFSAKPDTMLGAENFLIRKTPRAPFDADAGPDQMINTGQSVTLNAQAIGEAAIYNWYDTAGALVYTGQNLTVSPSVTEQYKLEIISTIDGFKDYDAATVQVRKYYINTLSPNPAHSIVNIDYHAAGASSGYVMLLNAATGVINSYIINPAQASTSINVSSYPVGIYTIVLVCNGQVADAKTLSIN